MDIGRRPSRFTFEVDPEPIQGYGRRRIRITLLRPKPAPNLRPDVRWHCVPCEQSRSRIPHGWMPADALASGRFRQVIESRRRGDHPLDPGSTDNDAGVAVFPAPPHAQTRLGLRKGGSSCTRFRPFYLRLVRRRDCCDATGIGESRSFTLRRHRVLREERTPPPGRQVLALPRRGEQDQRRPPTDLARKHHQGRRKRARRGLGRYGRQPARPGRPVRSRTEDAAQRQAPGPRGRAPFAVGRDETCRGLETAGAHTDKKSQRSPVARSRIKTAVLVLSPSEHRAGTRRQHSRATPIAHRQLPSLGARKEWPSHPRSPQTAAPCIRSGPRST